MNIAEKLARLRKDAGLSQKEIAQRAGISQSYYNEIEKGKDKIRCPIDTLGKICKAFNMSISKFLDETEDEPVLIQGNGLPQELQDVDVECISILKSALNEGLSYEDIKEILEVARKIKKP